MSDARLLVVHNAASDPVARLGTWLTDAGAVLEIVDGPQLPPTLDGFDGLVVLGGPMAANDDAVAPWLPHERQLLREAVSGEVPTLGICLGGQLLAAANGGRVIVNPEGPEIGAQLVAKRSAAATDPLFATLPITPDVIQWHFDTVATLPPGAVHLASSPLCEYQAFRVGRLAWGTQFHIETTPEMVRAWAAHYADELDEYDLERIVSRSDAVHDDLEEVWAPFAAAFVGVVRDPGSVPPPGGVRESVARPLTDPAAIRAALAAEANAARAPLPMPGLRSADDPPNDRA
jgi:GMP synthase (glutamine-hydrolysing)